MIISWENTLEPLWESAPDTSTQEIRYAINVDRKPLSAHGMSKHPSHEST
jgi:hypothetical protein